MFTRECFRSAFGREKWNWSREKEKLSCDAGPKTSSMLQSLSGPT